MYTENLSHTVLLNWKLKNNLKCEERLEKESVFLVNFVSKGLKSSLGSVQYL